jgi:hypothetical protein
LGYILGDFSPTHLVTLITDVVTALENQVNDNEDNKGHYSIGSQRFQSCQND